MSFLLEAMGLLPSPDDLTLKPKGGSAADVKGVYFFFFFLVTCVAYGSSGQGLNPRHSSDQSYYSDKARSLTC